MGRCCLLFKGSAVDGGSGVMEQKMEVRKGISTDELEQLGGGEVAYIKTLSSEEANEIYPLDDSLPEGISIYALHAADGTPIALTDSMQAALGQALDDELQVTSVH
jgi:hypothetical protein